jgi:molecular chaperone GrpE
VSRPVPDEEVVREEELEGDPEPEAGTERAPGPEPVAEAEAQSQPDAGARAAPEPDSEREPEAEPDTEAQPEPEPEDPLAKAVAERDEYLELARRTQADFENFRKRTAKDLAAAGERAKVGLVRELLPVVDNLERALASGGEESSLAEGVRLVLSELRGVLERNGVEALDPSGEQFDPTVHEALSTREADGQEPGVVVDVVEKGYRMSDTVVRPARVVVSA